MIPFRNVIEEIEMAQKNMYKIVNKPDYDIGYMIVS